MQNAVKRFQRQFGLSIDGVIGENSWNKILEVNKDIAAGNNPDVSTKYPGVVLKNGSTGDSVRCIQSYLNTISAKTGSSQSITVDGQYGNATTTMVLQFQAANGLTADGKVGSNTWSKLIERFNALV